MDDISHFPMNFYFIALFSCFVIFSVWGNPIFNDTHSRLDCKSEEYAIEDVIFEGNVIFLKSENITIYPGQYEKEGNKVLVCSTSVNISTEEIALNCSTLEYDSTEFEILPNNSVLLYGYIIPPNEYKLEGDVLITCELDYEGEENQPQKRVGNNTEYSINDAHILLGQIGSGISIIALILYLMTFCIVPALRSSSRYNLISLSIAFLLTYTFHLIGQVAELLHPLFCVISGVLKINFFLTAFFCMNVLAFDVWRTLKFGTKNLTVRSQDSRKKQFIWYSLYAWGCPLVISTLSVIFDNSDKIPENVKPKYGKDDICDLASYNGQIIFLTAPAFTLLIINGFFFATSFCMIYRSKFKNTDDENSETVKLNYILYLRLGIMMGMTWFIGVIALISSNQIVWMVFDLVNSLQGLLLFLFFTCRRNVIKHIREKMNPKENSREDNAMALSNFSNLSNNN